MQEVQVLEATRTAPNSRGRVRSNQNELTLGFLLMRRLPEPRPTSEPDFRK